MSQAEEKKEEKKIQKKMKIEEKGVRPSYRQQDAESKMKQKLQEEFTKLNAKEAEGAALTRYNFIEMLVRVAVFLHARADVEPTEMFGGVPGFVANFVDRGIIGSVYSAPMAPFPAKALWSSEVQDVMHEHTRTLRELHRSFGGNVQGLLRLAQLSHLFGREFTAKHVRSVFAMSKTLVPDPLPGKGSTSLRFNEFLEALARCSVVRRPERELKIIFSANADEDPNITAQRKNILSKCLSNLLETLDSKLKKGSLG
jgi:hypothetical protein